MKAALGWEDDFAHKFEIFDPLERPIPDKDNNYTLKVKDLK